VKPRFSRAYMTRRFLSGTGSTEYQGWEGGWSLSFRVIVPETSTTAQGLFFYYFYHHVSLDDTVRFGSDRCVSTTTVISRPIAEMAVDSGTATLIMAYVLTVVSFLIIFSRIFLRRLKNEPFKLDDWVMLAAIPIYFVNTACYQVIIPNGSNLTPLPKDFTQNDIDSRKILLPIFLALGLNISQAS
jgi:hypothetical protein